MIDHSHWSFFDPFTTRKVPTFWLNVHGVKYTWGVKWPGVKCLRGKCPDTILCRASLLKTRQVTRGDGKPKFLKPNAATFNSALNLRTKSLKLETCKRNCFAKHYCLLPIRRQIWSMLVIKKKTFFITNIVEFKIAEFCFKIVLLTRFVKFQSASELFSPILSDYNVNLL